MSRLTDYTMSDNVPGVASNMTSENNLLGRAHQYNSSTVCQETDFLTQNVFRPAVEATFRKFVEVCTPEVDAILPETWTLCTTEGTFSCDSLSKYAKACKRKYIDHVLPGTTENTILVEPHRCTMGHAMQEDEMAILILVGLVFLGVLVGIALTVALCLICPGVHRWALTRIKRSKESKVVRASTVSSEYYAAIEDNNTMASAIRLRPAHRLPSPLPVPDDSPRYPTGTSPGPSPVGDPDFNSPTYQSNGLSSEPIYTDTSGAVSYEPGYEHLDRNNPHAQSHKYAHIDNPATDHPVSPESATTDSHDYFTLAVTT